MKEAGAEQNLERRADILRRAEEILMRELPWIPVLHFGTKNLVSPKVHGFHQNARGVAPTRFLALHR
jgi:oligopeptide transport system substrate-binding protein